MSGGAETEIKFAFFIDVCTDVCENNVCIVVVFCGGTKLPFDGSCGHDKSSVSILLLWELHFGSFRVW